MSWGLGRRDVYKRQLLDRSCYIFRKEGCAVRGRKKFLQTVAVLTGHLDIKSLELSLERIVTGKLGAPVPVSYTHSRCV